MVSVQRFNLHYGAFHALKDVTVDFPARQITALIGPSGCGKSTLLRSLNRMNDLVPGVRIDGQVRIGGAEIYSPAARVEALRRRVGMVFQRPNPFPLSIAENLTYGPRLHGPLSRQDAAAMVEESLRAVGLWDALSSRLDDSALTLAPEQQQRLCIARALATRPDVLLMDEPCSALDPIATRHVEELMIRLAERYTIVIVTHNMQQAQRVARHSGFMWLGELLEFGDTASLFTAPREIRTADYVGGRYG
jgi:phosphate transport system ATP-binding protein